jgi:O-antigen ligase
MTTQTRALPTGLLGLVAGGGFLLLYPLFFVYHFALGSGLFSPFALGLYGPATVLTAAVGGLPLAEVIRRYAGHPLMTTTAFFMFYCTAWVLLFGYIFPDNPYLDDVNFQSFSLIVSWLALFTVGLFFPWQSMAMRRACFGLFAMIGLIIAANTSWSALVLTMPGENTGDNASYQGFARSVFVLSLALLAWSRNRSEQIGIWLTSSLFLFVIGARSEFAAYVATTLLAAFIIRRAHPARTLLMVVVVVLIWVLASGLGTSIAESLGQSRQAGLLDIGGDTSWNARRAMHDFALGQIAEQPIFGIYGGHVYFYNPELGSEAHNALSAWVTFGVLGFCLYVGLTVATLWLSIRFFLARPQRPDVRFALYMALSVSILIFTAKSVYWAEPALAWGMVAALVIRRRSVMTSPDLTQPTSGQVHSPGTAARRSWRMTR